MPVDGDAARQRLVEAREQRAQRRLAGARGTDEGDRLAGADRQVDALQHRAPVGVGEADALVADVAAERRRGHGAGAIDHVGRRRHELLVAAEAGDPLGVELEHRLDLLDRPEEDVHQQQEADEAAGRQVARDHVVGARHHHHHVGEAQPQVAERDARRHHPVRLELGGAVGEVVAREQRPLVVLVGEGLHHPDAADVLLDAVVELGDPVEERAPVGGQAGAVAPREPDAERQHQPGQDRERHVEGEHQRQRAHQGHDGHEGVLGAVVGDLADFLEVLGQARDQVAGLVLVEVPEGEPLQVVEGVGAQVGLDVHAQHVAPVRHHRHQRRRCAR